MLLISVSSGLECFGIVFIVMEKNMVKIMICRILFCVIVFVIDVGIRWVRNFLIENVDIGRLVDCFVVGSVFGKLVLGCSRFIMIRLSSSEMKDVLMN